MEGQDKQSQQADLSSGFGKPISDFILPLTGNKIIKIPDLNINPIIKTQLHLNTIVDPENLPVISDDENKVITERNKVWRPLAGRDFTKICNLFANILSNPDPPESRTENVKQDYHTENIIKKQKDSLKLVTNELELASNIIVSVNIREWWTSFLEDKLDPPEKGKKQFGFTFVFMETCAMISKRVYPCNQSENSNIKVHSEVILIQHLHDLIKTCGAKVIKIFIYTFHSPCLERKGDDTECCTSQLVKSARQWYKQYGIKTTVGFTEYWGSNTSPNLFENLKYSDISNLNSDYFSYYTKFKDKPFKLYHTKLSKYVEKNPQYKEFLDASNNQRQHTASKNIINSALDQLGKKAKKLFDHREEHLNRINTFIDEFKTHQHVPEEICAFLTELWRDMIDYNFMKYIEKEQKAEFDAEKLKKFAAKMGINQGGNNPLKFVKLTI